MCLTLSSDAKECRGDAICDRVDVVEDEATVLLIRIATSKRKPRKRGIILNYEVMFVMANINDIYQKRYSTRRNVFLFMCSLFYYNLNK